MRQYADFENSRVTSPAEADPGGEIIGEIAACLQKRAAGELASLQAAERQAELILREKKEQGVICSFLPPLSAIDESGARCRLVLDFALPAREENITAAVELEAEK